MEIEVRFDSPDRAFHMGQQVSGKVIVASDSDASVSEVWLDYRWRTHGEGNRDKGPEEHVPVARLETPIRAGNPVEFPFRFDAPNGPITYHGRHLNVDWYLKAQARTSPLFSPLRVVKVEEDFIVLPGRPNTALRLGTRKIELKDIAVRRKQELSAAHNLPMAQPDAVPVSFWHSGIGRVLTWVVYALLGVAMFATCEGFSWLMAPHRILPALATTAGFILITLGVIYLRNNAYKQKLEVEELVVEPSMTYPGNAVSCRLDLTARRAVFLQRITASISHQERVTRVQGTTTVTDVHVLSHKTYEKVYNEELAPGRALSFRCALPVDAEAPPSFTSLNNALEWTTSVQVQLKGWPGMTRTIPIVVLP